MSSVDLMYQFRWCRPKVGFIIIYIYIYIYIYIDSVFNYWNIKLYHVMKIEYVLHQVRYYSKSSVPLFISVETQRPQIKNTCTLKKEVYNDIHYMGIQARSHGGARGG